MNPLILSAVALLSAADPAGKFSDVVIEKPYAVYLRGNPLLMEVAGAKVIRLPDGKQVVLGVASVALADDSPRARLQAERVCLAKALASVVGEKSGVQVAHVEKVEDRTVIVIDKGKETARSVAKVMSLTELKVRGVARGLTIVGRWRSKDRKVFYLAIGGLCDRKGEPITPKAKE
jgi:hypothetical protein